MAQLALSEFHKSEKCQPCGGNGEMVTHARTTHLLLDWESTTLFARGQPWNHDDYVLRLTIGKLLTQHQAAKTGAGVIDTQKEQLR